MIKGTIIIIQVVVIKLFVDISRILCYINNINYSYVTQGERNGYEDYRQF